MSPSKRQKPEREEQQQERRKERREPRRRQVKKQPNRRKGERRERWEMGRNGKRMKWRQANERSDHKSTRLLWQIYYFFSGSVKNTLNYVASKCPTKISKKTTEEKKKREYVIEHLRYCPLLSYMRRSARDQHTTKQEVAANYRPFLFQKHPLWIILVWFSRFHSEHKKLAGGIDFTKTITVVFILQLISLSIKIVFDFTQREFLLCTTKMRLHSTRWKMIFYQTM